MTMNISNNHDYDHHHGFDHDHCFDHDQTWTILLNNVKIYNTIACFSVSIVLSCIASSRNLQLLVFTLIVLNRIARYCEVFDYAFPNFEKLN